MIVLSSFWNVIFGGSGVEKPIKMRFMSFCFLLIFYRCFHYFCVLGGPYVGSTSFFCRIVFTSILDRFGSRFRGHLGGLGGGPNRSFWDRCWNYFCVSAQERPKSAQEQPIVAQGRAQSTQECPKSAPRAAKSGSRAANSATRAAQEQVRAVVSGCLFARFGDQNLVWVCGCHFRCDCRCLRRAGCRPKKKK